MTEAPAEPIVGKTALEHLLDGARPLDAWERNRSLIDAIAEAYDLIDISNREARFALILMGSLNAFLVLVATRSELLATLDATQRIFIMSKAGVYVVVAVYFVLEAIEALKPGRFRPNLEGWSRERHDYPQGVRYYEDVVAFVYGAWN